MAARRFRLAPLPPDRGLHPQPRSAGLAAVLRSAALVATVTLVGGAAAAQPSVGDGPNRFDRSDERLVGGRLWLQVPFSRLHAGTPPDTGIGYTMVGGSASLTLLDWAEIEAGAGWGGSPGISPEIDFMARGGVTPPLHDGRDGKGAGLSVQGVALAGYRFLSWGQGCDSCTGAELHVLGLSAGIELTYWFAARFGLGFRALGDVGIVAAGEADRYYTGELEVVGDVLGGYTASLGLAF